MASLDTLPIRRKLTLAITLASASSLLCAFLVFFRGFFHNLIIDE